MLDPEQLRRIDPDLVGMSDEEVEALKADMYETIQLAYDIWWFRKNGSKNPIGSMAQSRDHGIVDICNQNKDEQA
ncbi:MAG: hypothetical protein P4L81_06855 [Candidatus Pacebacteria bacterium]|nr:hypothetical protein [Candidatus Paceibacterota bacterium]